MNEFDETNPNFRSQELREASADQPVGGKTHLAMSSQAKPKAKRGTVARSAGSRDEMTDAQSRRALENL